MILSVSIPGESPRKRVYQEHQYQSFIFKDAIKHFSDINESLCPLAYSFQQYDDRVVISKLTNSYILIPEDTVCTHVDSKLHVKHFYQGRSVPLPQWFRQVQDCPLSRKSMLENFPIYLESYSENISPIFDELQKHMFTKQPVYSAEIVIYALLLR